MPKREYSGAAKPTVLSGTISAGALTINVVDAVGFPTGASAPFVVTIDAGLASEEKILVGTRTGNTFSGVTRGYDGTTAYDHANQARVEHTLSAIDMREANDHVNDRTGDPHPQYLTPTEGAALYSSATHTHLSTTRVLRMPLHTFRLPGDITVAGNGEHMFFVGALPTQGVRLVRAIHRIDSGTNVYFDLYRNGAEIPEWTNMKVGTTRTVTNGPFVQLNDTDAISLAVTGVLSTSQDLTVTLIADYTFQV